MNSAHVGQTQLIDYSLGAEVVEEKGVVGGDEDLAQGRWEDHIDLGETLLHDRPLAGIGPVKAADENLSCVAI